MTESWAVYIVRCADRTLYTGIARDVHARVRAHNAGTGAKYTRGRNPVKLVYLESAPTRGAALRREHAIKRLRLEVKQQLIAATRRCKRNPSKSDGLKQRPI